MHKIVSAQISFIVCLAIKLPVAFLVFSLGGSSALPAPWHPSCAQRVRAKQICPLIHQQQLGVRKHVVHSNYPQVIPHQQTRSRPGSPDHPRGLGTRLHTTRPHIDTNRAGPGTMASTTTPEGISCVIWRFVFLSNVIFISSPYMCDRPYLWLNFWMADQDVDDREGLVTNYVAMDGVQIERSLESSQRMLLQDSRGWY